MTFGEGAPAAGGIRFRARGHTDVGKVREENQDAFAVLETGEGVGPGEIVAVLADGMGGLAGGATASRLVVESVTELVRRGGASPGEVIRAGIAEANSRIFARSGGRLDAEPMGSTATTLAARGKEAWVAHVGDSRAYRIPPAGAIARLTRDHSWVEELSRRGAIEEGSLQYALHRNVLTRGVGLRPEVEVDLTTVRDVVPGDIFILCSDGLHEMVRETEIEARVRRGGPLESIAADLVELALERGGPDNITIVAIAAEAEASPAAPSPSAAGSPSRRLFPPGGFMPLSLLLAFALGVACVLLLERSPGEPPGREHPLDALIDEVMGGEPGKTPEEKELREAIEAFREARSRGK